MARFLQFGGSALWLSKFHRLCYVLRMASGLVVVELKCNFGGSTWLISSPSLRFYPTQDCSFVFYVALRFDGGLMEFRQYFLYLVLSLLLSFLAHLLPDSGCLRRWLFRELCPLVSLCSSGALVAPVVSLLGLVWVRTCGFAVTFVVELVAFYWFFSSSSLSVCLAFGVIVGVFVLVRWFVANVVECSLSSLSVCLLLWSLVLSVSLGPLIWYQDEAMVSVSSSALVRRWLVRVRYGFLLKRFPNGGQACACSLARVRHQMVPWEVWLLR
ncbi:unnamed protein product [Arabis nemorensis]|uniref:Transmembrane protein n=1 Tax=Arabis nemorensis TaxID=586526 RepID=A0A565C4B1_9BRAS|nr:unnamed protein product [Arabis nemorensis]